MRRLILIRHPATALSGEAFCGHTDPELSPAGEAQLTTLCRRLRQIDLHRIMSSDLRRARRCADAIARQHALEAQLRPALREIHFGAWEGLRWSDIEARYGEEARRWMAAFPAHTAPGAEAYTDFARRIRREASGWLRDAAGETLAVVSHRGVLQYLLQSHSALAAAEAWQLTATPATVIFCEVRANSSFAVRQTWSPGRPVRP
jgi:broad specificity phosphatase PhoE